MFGIRFLVVFVVPVLAAQTTGAAKDPVAPGEDSQSLLAQKRWSSSPELLAGKKTFLTESDWRARVWDLSKDNEHLRMLIAEQTREFHKVKIQRDAFFHDLQQQRMRNAALLEKLGELQNKIQNDAGLLSASSGSSNVGEAKRPSFPYTDEPLALELLGNDDFEPMPVASGAVSDVGHESNGDKREDTAFDGYLAAPEAERLLPLE